MAQKTKKHAAESVEQKNTDRPHQVLKDRIYDIGLDYLKDAFTYDKDTGELRWSESRPPSHFSSNAYYLRYLKLRSGKIAGSLSGVHGYANIQIKGKVSYAVHRIVFYMNHGWLPDSIDHINNIRNDNRIANMRPANKASNAMNRSFNKNNKSGFKGVDFIKRRNVFRAQIQKDGKKIIIGTYDNAEDAHNAYCMASKLTHGIFGNFGR